MPHSILFVSIFLTGLTLFPYFHMVESSSIGSDYPTLSKLFLEESVERMRNSTVTPGNQRTLETSLTPEKDSANNIDDDGDVGQHGYQDFLERLSDLGVGYIIRDLYTSAITEDNEIKTVLGDLGRIGVGAYLIQKLGESEKFDFEKSRALTRLSRYIGVGITLVGSYFDLYLLFDSIGCLVRRKRLENATGMKFKFNSRTAAEESFHHHLRSLEMTSEPEEQQPPTVFCKREYPVLEIIAAFIATISDAVAFVFPEQDNLAASVETLWQVIAFYYVEAEKRGRARRRGDGEGQRSLGNLEEFRN